jgi:serine phosphatase RsbU (regulator of sigma subunit)
MATSWAAQRLAEFLAAISASPDAASAVTRALEWTAETLEAEVAAMVRSGRVVDSVGFPAGEAPVERLVAVVAAGGGLVPIPPGLEGQALVIALDSTAEGGHLLLARAEERSFTREEANLARALARILALTLRMLGLLTISREKEEENARLIAALSERRVLLERLTRIQRSISHQVDLQSVLDAIVVGARELLSDDLAVLWLVDPANPAQLVAASTSGFPPAGLGLPMRLPADQDLVGRAMRTGEPIVVENPDAEERAICAPVREGGQATGAIAVSSFGARPPYTTYEREALMAFAEHVRLAIANARTLDELAAQRRTELEFDLARKILADLSPAAPAHHPCLDVYAETRPTHLVGGDFFDFESGEDEDLVCVLGDVAGKGIPAALLVAMTRSAIRVAVRAAGATAPRGVLERANSDLYQDFSQLGLFATVLLTRFDFRTRTLRLVNAGHSPVIYRPAGGRARLVRAKAPPIGVEVGWRGGGTACLRLGANDLLVAATDGFSDAVSLRTGQLFGHERLLDLTDQTARGSAADIAAAFFDATDDFSSGGGPSDDRTLVVVRGAPGGQVPAGRTQLSDPAPGPRTCH